MRLGEQAQNLAPEQAPEHVDVHEEVRLGRDPSRPILGQPATRHDHVHVRMMRHRRAPGMQHSGDADAGAEVLGIGGDLQRGLGRGLHQQAVDHALVLVGDVAQLGRQRVDDVEVRHGQQLGLACFEPLARGRPLAPRTMPVTATVVGDDRVAAGVVLAARNMAAERRGAAALDGRHHFQLAKAHVAAVGVTPSGTVVAEDIRNLQSWTGHAPATCRGFLPRLRGALSRSSGLSIEVMSPVATRA